MPLYNILSELKAIRGLLERSEERELVAAENAKQQFEEYMNLTVQRCAEETQRVQEAYKEEHMRRYHPELAKPAKVKAEKTN